MYIDISLTLATLWITACQAPLSMGFSRQEYWSGHFLLQGIFLTQESNPGLQHGRQILYQLSYMECICNCCSIAKSCPTLCDPTSYSTPGFSVHHYLSEFAQIYTILCLCVCIYICNSICFLANIDLFHEKK